jgi:hypothetical protein
VLGGWTYYLIQALMFRSHDKHSERMLLDEVVRELRGFGFTFATSAFWELFIEEGAPSKNDQITTSIAGYSGGKTIARVIRFLMDKENGPHRIELGVGAASNGTAFVSAAADIDDFHRSADLRAKASADAHGLHSASVFTQAAIAGYGTDNGGVRTWFGVSSAYDYARQEARQGVQKDRTGVVEIVDLSARGSYRTGRFALSGKLDLGLDFAMVDSHALAAYKAAGGNMQNTKPTLSKDGYYFAKGLTLRPQFAVSFGALDLSARATYHHLESIEGESRKQTNITNDFHLSDQKLTLELGASYRLSSVRLGAGYEGTWRSGQIGQLETSSFNASIGLQLSYTR